MEKLKIQTIDQAYLMAIVLLAPNLFKNYIIFESDEIEDFDVGMKELWLKTIPEEINTQKRWKVFGSKPKEEDGCIITHHEKVLFQKPKFLNGKIDEQSCYRHRILHRLRALENY